MVATWKKCQFWFRVFNEVFSEDLPGLPPTRQVELESILYWVAAHVARAPYRLSTVGKMKELASKQLHELTDKGFIRTSSSPFGVLQSYSSRRKMEIQFLGHVSDCQGIHRCDLPNIESIKVGRSPKNTNRDSAIFRALPAIIEDLSEGVFKDVEIIPTNFVFRSEGSELPMTLL
ncbi:hypothetical protein Tco_1174351 [Tanacetum coccineum]